MSGTETGGAPKRGSVRMALLWASFGQGAFFVLQFGSTVILARLLSPREMGVFAIGVATVSLVSSLQALGLNNYLIRADDVGRPILSTVFTVNLILSLAISAAIIALGLLSEHMFQEPGTVRVMLWLSTTPLLGAIGLVPSSLLQREGDFRALSLLRIFSTVSGNALTVAMAFAGFSYMSLAYGWVLTCAANALGACFLAPRHIHWRVGLTEWRHVSGFGLKMIFINGTAQVQRQVVNLILGRFQGLEAVGLYSRANNLFSLLMENTQTVAMRVFLVDFSDAARRGLSLKDRYQKVVECMTALLWPLFGGLAVLSGPCVRLMYGPKWETLALPLSFLCVSGVIWCAISMSWEVFVVANATGEQARLEVKRSVVGTLMFLIGCQFSLNIAVATRILESIYAVLLYGPPVARFTGCTTTDLMPIYARNAVVTIAAIAPSTILMIAYNWSQVTPLLYVMASVGAGAVAWGLALLLLKHPLLTELQGLLRKRRKTPPVVGVA